MNERPSRLFFGALFLAASLVGGAAPPVDLDRNAQDAADVEVTGVVGADLERVEVDVRIRYTSSLAREEVPIVLAADRYREIGALRPSEVRELFPDGFDRGGFDRVAITIDGQICTPRIDALHDGGRIFWCPAKLKARETIEIAVLAELSVPARYGPFGRVGRALTLAAGWYPTVADPAVGPPRGPHLVRVKAPSELAALLGRQYFPSAGDRGSRWLTARIQDAAQVPLLLAPASARVASFLGGRARFLSWSGSEVQGEAPASVQLREVRAALEEAVRFFGEEGLELPTAEDPLVAVEAPLRHDLAQAAEGLVLVSDHAFRVPDFERFQRFHRLPLLRELFGRLVARGLSSRGGSAAENALAADAVGAWLLERYIASRFGRAEDAFDVLGIVSFIPSIDSMLYAPDLPFVAAYFRFISEEDPLRPDLLAYPAPLPRGKILLEKLADRIGHQGTERVMRALISGGELLPSTTLGFQDPGEARSFLEQWLGPYPRLQYRLASWTSRPAPQRCGGCVTAEVSIERRGDIASEPVSVLLKDTDGGQRIVVAEATPLALRTLTATLAAPLDLVELDPLGRLAEAPTDDDPSPRFDNRSRPAWKILLNSFNVVLAATAGQVDTALDVGFQRRYDPHLGLALRAEWAQEAAALTTRASYGFGKAVSAARFAQGIGLSLSGEYLRPGFAGAERGGPALSLGLSYGFDDRESQWAPESGTALRASASFSHAFVDLSSSQLSADTVSVSLRALKQWMLGARHQLSLRLALGAYLLGEPRAQLRFSIGGRGAIRGYAFDAELGRVRGVVSAEWLHPLIPRLSFDGLHLAWVTGIDGVLFSDAGWIGDDFTQALRSPVLADVGYGLRIYIDYGGVRPGVIAFDIGVPLVRPPGAAFLGPPAIYIAFAQSFTAI